MTFVVRAPVPGVVLFALVFVLGCANPSRPGARSAGVSRVAPPPVTVPSFDAESVDVSIDAPAPGGGGAAGDRANVKLTASDGSGLRLTSLTVRAVLYGPLAFTEVHLAFLNPEPRTREGTFSIALPEGAAVSRFAMHLPDGWQEGEVVERETARAAFDSLMHRKVDPALLERDAGNVFRGRVFPILGNETKEIVIAYTETLPRHETPYRFPLLGLPALETLDVQLLVPSRRKAFVHRRTGVTPDRDFSYQPPEDAPAAVRGGRFAVVRLTKAAEPVLTTAKPESLAVLVDSSASAASTYAADVARAARVVEALGPSSVKVACFDQEVVPIASIADAASRRPGGASDLGKGLTWLASTGASRAVIVSDGHATIGPRGGQLVAMAGQLKGAGVHRLDVLAARGADLAGLRELVQVGLADDGIVVDDTASAEVALRALRAKAPSMRKAKVVDAAHVWPSSLSNGAKPSGSALAFAEIDEARPLRVSVDGGPVQAIERAEAAPAALVAQAVAEARIRELSAERAAPTTTPSRREELGHEIVALSIEHRVVSDLTAMLVLETDADYRRFKLSRTAMRDVPIVGPRGVEIAARGGGPVPSPRTGAMSPLVDDASAGASKVDGSPARSPGLIQVDSDQVLVVPQVHFGAGSAELLPEALVTVDQVALVLLERREIELVSIIGHSDRAGDSARNQSLSERRALTVRDALVARGVAPDRLVAKGWGDTAPLVDPSDTAEARAKNRRVEFRILRADGKPTHVEEGPGPSRPALTAPPTTAWQPVDMQKYRDKAAPAGAPLTGRLAAIEEQLAARSFDAALAAAGEWVAASPDEMLAWIAQGRAFEALGRRREASRAYGSLVDLATRPEHRRGAAAFLEGTRDPRALEVALDAYARAVDERPEQPSSYRLYAWALARSGRLEAALDVTFRALGRRFDERRFATAAADAKHDLGLFAAAAMKAHPEKAAALRPRLAALNVPVPTEASTTVALTWENDETDLDLLVYDAKGRLALPRHDLRTSFGTELLRVERRALFPLRIDVQLVTQGPTGWAVGKVAIVRHDGRGTLQVEDRPFVVMQSGAAASLGTMRAP